MVGPFLYVECILKVFSFSGNMLSCSDQFMISIKRVMSSSLHISFEDIYRPGLSMFLA